MRLKLFLFVLICLVSHWAMAQNYQWANLHGAVFNSPKVAANGTFAVYTASFTNSITIGGQTITSNGQTNSYLNKSDLNGNSLWLKKFVADGIEILDVKIDNRENIVVCGNYNDYLIIGDTIFKNNISNSFFFVAKFSAAGHLIWAKSSNQYNSGIDGNIGLDSEGNIYCSSSYTGTIAFGTNLITATPWSGTPKVFLVKFDSRGNFIWGRNLGSGAVLFEYPAMTITPNDEVYVSLTNRPTFSSGFTGFQLYKFNKAGTQQNLKVITLGPTSPSSVTHSPKLKADLNNNVYMVGIFQLSANFGTTSVSSSNQWEENLFLAKIDPAGNWQWAQKVATGNYAASKITLANDYLNNLTVAGNLKGSALFGSTQLTTPANVENTFIAKLTPAGSVLNAYLLSSPNLNYCGNIVNDKFGNHIVTGTLDNNLSFSGINLSGTRAGFAAKFIYNANSVTGNFFVDSNSNGNWETNELPYANGILQTGSGTGLLSTSEKGSYTAYYPAGAFTLTPISLLQHYTFTPISDTVSFSGIGQSKGRNFALTPIPNRDDVKITVTNITPARPGFTLKYRITLENVGTTTQSDTLSFNYNAQYLTYNASSQTSLSQTPGKISWFYQPLAPFEKQNIDVQFTVATNTPLNTQLTAHALANPLTDFINWNNQDTLKHLVSGSFDPNDKQVSYTQLTPSQVADSTLLNYVIRFQNTGTDTAFTVIIQDSISDKLLMPTFELLSASHPFTFRLLENGKAEWRFDNILLPDSNRNERASHGFIRYRMQPRNNLVLGDEIKSRAAIFFDYNAAVNTNYAITRISNLTGFADDKTAGNAFKLYPNPAKETVMVEADLKQAKSATVSLVNMLGQTIQKETLVPQSQNHYQMNLIKLPKGVYIVKLETKGKILTQRLIIQ